MKYTSLLPESFKATVLIRDGSKQLERTVGGDLYLVTSAPSFHLVNLTGDGNFKFFDDNIRVSKKLTNYIRALSHELSAKQARENKHGTE